MAQTTVENMVTEITFEPMVITATPPGQHGGADDIARLREILRPLITDLLVEEYDTLRRIMGG
ncbi:MULTISPECIES: hypothetical protein [Paracoccus]|uniref:hypothetical protein n=1 Tax=Paracoccus TaxID=265 RepID=UPI00035E9675|nr:MULTISPECIES: hypothetical protein [Paracoccus]MCV2446160.1 hypothetical protein [Paracoccus sp. DMF]MDQ7777214.1 hypothetical protein [Paracoccus aminovorans]